MDNQVSVWDHVANITTGLFGEFGIGTSQQNQSNNLYSSSTPSNLPNYTPTPMYGSSILGNSSTIIVIAIILLIAFMIIPKFIK